METAETKICQNCPVPTAVVDEDPRMPTTVVGASG